MKSSTSLFVFLVCKLIVRAALSIIAIGLAAIVVKDDDTTALAWFMTFGSLNLLSIFGNVWLACWSSRETYHDPLPITLAVVSFFNSVYVRLDIFLMIVLAIWGFIVASAIQSDLFPFVLSASIMETIYASHSLYNHISGNWMDSDFPNFNIEPKK